MKRTLVPASGAANSNGKRPAKAAPVAVVVPAEVRRDVSVPLKLKDGSSGRPLQYAPTTLVMMFDSAEQLAEIRRILNGGTP